MRVDAHSNTLTSKGFVIVTLVLAIGPQCGQAGLWPSGAEWQKAALGALTDPYTWVPTAGAAVTGLTGLDDTISDWAVDDTPLFGSPESARDWSDHLRSATHVGMLATAVGVPDPWSATFKRMLVEEAAAVATTSVTAGLKSVADRQRPDQSDEESFPSSHSSRAFAYAAMGSMNIDDLFLQEPIQLGLHLGLTGLAAGTAWARVEAGVHFPSDVLFGAALGNFMGRFIQEAFLGRRESPRVSFYWGGDTALMGLSFQLR